MMFSREGAAKCRCLPVAVLVLVACSGSLTAVAADGTAVDQAMAVQPYADQPRYWQYRGEPVLLLGGTRQDNLFQIPDLEQHLDTLAGAGGNYIRNTMSSRDDGNLWPFARVDDHDDDEAALYDLDRFNEAYWDRFERMLRLTHERGIIVQIELWDFWDFFDVWQQSPWNPENNVSYTADDTQLGTAYASPTYAAGETEGEPHDFFHTVPDKHHDAVVLGYQQRFVDRLLEHALAYDHVLFCVTNEIHQPQPLAWSVYWADYVRDRAAEIGREVYATEMFWVFDFGHEQHQPALEDPQTFNYFEASQNSAINDAEANWRNLQYAWHRLSDHPRPINHTKLYGADDGPVWAGSTEEVVQQFWRNIVGGAASSRFHRLPAGIGLSETAQRQLRSARALEQRLDVFRLQPDSEHALLGDRRENEAYLGYQPGRQYAVYFPDGGSVTLDLTGTEGAYTLHWLEIGETRWQEADAVEAGDHVTLTTPGDGQWLAVLVRRGNG